MLFFPLITAVALLIVGIYALRQNPRRPTNRVLAAVCFVSTVSLILQLIARIYGERYWVDHVSNPMPWVRARLSVIGLLCPFMVWMCYYVISGRYAGRHDLIRKLAPWAGISLFLMVIPFTEAFKPSASRPDNILEGPLYTVYLVMMLACLLSVCVASMAVAPRLSGIRQLEFRFITIAFGYLAAAVILVSLINTLFPSLRFTSPLVRTLSFLVFLAFGVSAWSITSRRVYQSSQVFLPLAERFAAMALVAIPSAYLVRWVAGFDRSLWAPAGVIALACVGFLYLDDRLRGLLNLKSEQRTSAAAKQLQTVAGRELNPDGLITRFEAVLGAFADDTRVRILTSEQDGFARNDLRLASRQLRSTQLISEGWVSVVSLARTARRNESQSLRSELEAERIHLLVSPHWSEGEPGVVVAVDERENGVPFTYPEIKTLRTLAEIMDGLYTRCRFALQARQAEQLATIGLIGASLAHELRNPIVAIDTFAQLLPARLNDVGFLKDFAEVIPGEAKRIQALTDQLMDLARPRKYECAPVDIHAVVGDSVALLKQKAQASQITLKIEASAPDPIIVADAPALRQVLLNLLLNSIQSIAQTNCPGCVIVRTMNVERQIVIETEDNGPGIPEAVQNRLFHPFASAGKAGGLGLGLAICAEIVKIHHGTISVESHRGGALFRISLPVAGPHELGQSPT